MKHIKIDSCFKFLLLLLLPLFNACTQSDFKKQDEMKFNQIFHHTDTLENYPWKHKTFDNASEKFTFAVFSDLTGGERDRIFEVAVEQLNLLRPEFIVNVGDLIEGGESDTAEWHRQWDSFDARASQASAPVFYMGGNHDLTGQLARHVWKERNGARYYHFRYKNALFLVMDTEDNSPERMAEIEELRNKAVEVYKMDGPEAFAETEYASIPERTSGTIGLDQVDYFLNVIKENNDVLWTFILIHKPAWENKNDQNFTSIEKAMAERPYTVFYGHTHVYNYQERNDRDYINLETTGGEQFPEKGPSFDQLTLVTVDSNGVNIANLKMSGILDKTGSIPLNGDTIVFEMRSIDQ